MTGTLFFNPSSGAKASGAVLQELEDAARDEGLEVIRLTGDVNVPETVRRYMSEGRKLFVAAGGDGTVNHVLQALVQTDAELAVIPLGTYNHFAKDLGIPLDWQHALDVALHGSVEQIDTARVNDRFFVNNLSIGLYPEVVARREARGRDFPRWRARLEAAYATLRKYRHVTVTIESDQQQQVVRTHMFVVSNNSYDLSRIGIEAPRHSLTTGRLSVYWLPELPRLALFRFGAHYLAGRVKDTPGFRSFATTRVKVHSPHPRLRLGIDGEVITSETPLSITIVPLSLLVKVPRS